VSAPWQEAAVKLYAGWLAQLASEGLRRRGWRGFRPLALADMSRAHVASYA